MTVIESFGDNMAKRDLRNFCMLKLSSRKLQRDIAAYIESR